MTDTLDAARAADPVVLADLRDGLGRARKELPPKYFYDEHGSRLFEEITRLPEYYLTRTERALLERWMPEWIAAAGTRTLIELGAGSAVKTRIILDAMLAAGTGAAYVPVDVSAEFLAETAADLSADYPDLAVVPVAADFAAGFPLPGGLPAPVLHAFLGSTIGNFSREQAVALLRAVRARMRADDRFLMGVDLRKDPAVIEAAYNDAAGVTAAFNLNMLRVLNARAGTDFDPAAFAHRAFYDRAKHRIEMHLVSRRPQAVAVPGVGAFTLEEGETIRTEISCKHDRASVDAMLAAAGLKVERWQTDDAGLYALLTAVPA